MAKKLGKIPKQGFDSQIFQGEDTTLDTSQQSRQTDNEIITIDNSSVSSPTPTRKRFSTQQQEISTSVVVDSSISTVSRSRIRSTDNFSQQNSVVDSEISSTSKPRRENRGGSVPNPEDFVRAEAVSADSSISTVSKPRDNHKQVSIPNPENFVRAESVVASSSISTVSKRRDNHKRIPIPNPEDFIPSTETSEEITLLQSKVLSGKSEDEGENSKQVRNPFQRIISSSQSKKENFQQVGEEIQENSLFPTPTTVEDNSLFSFSKRGN